ncbi:MAG: tRNA (guanosine(37)-N1)-methyltransferase TrmD [Bacillus subtilis]|nr:tRNA (guanosine(37)-N1)-methyltransferase TrmD [Bacillus subtilis]
MKITVLTLFPEVFEAVFQHVDDVVRPIEINAVSTNGREHPRPYDEQTQESRRLRVWRRPGHAFAGRADPPRDSIRRRPRDRTEDLACRRKACPIPRRRRRNWPNSTNLILVCGHYEGFDDRVRHFVDEEISIGDYVMTGGEIGAMAIADSVIRLLPGVLASEESFTDESFYDGLLEYPQFTRPKEYLGLVRPRRAALRQPCRDPQMATRTIARSEPPSAAPICLQKRNKND